MSKVIPIKLRNINTTYSNLYFTKDFSHILLEKITLKKNSRVIQDDAAKFWLNFHENLIRNEDEISF